MGKEDMEIDVQQEYEKDELHRFIKILEDEKRYLEMEIRKLQNEIERLKSELKKLREAPMIVGYIEGKASDNMWIVRSTTGPTVVVPAASYIDDRELQAGRRVALNKQSLAIIDVLPDVYDPSVTAAEVIERPSVTYEEVGGLSQQILELREAIEYPLLKPELYKKVGIEPPKGVLLVGPPGTGKTLLAKAVAHHTRATFIRVVGSELVRKYIGEGARIVRELFDLARKKAPSILFIDEIDAIGARRMDISTSGDREVQRTLMQLLAEMDGFEPLSDVKIIGATNRPDILDEALLRPGRFDRIIEIPMPNLEAREEIFRIHTRKMNIVGVDLKYLARKTDGMTGADIKAICTEAGMFAIRENRDYVTMADFEKAILKVMRSPKLERKNYHL